MEYKEGKVKIEELRKPSEYEVKEVAEVYGDFYDFRNQRSGTMRQFQNRTFEDYLSDSRQLFWTSIINTSEDLEAMDLEFALPFVRKEVLEFLGRITSMNMKLQLSGDELGIYGVKVLQSIYKKWQLKNKDKVEKFWAILYGIVNGTVCQYIGFDGNESKKKYLRQYDSESGAYNLEEKMVKMWNDVTSEIVPIEEIYLQKIWQRNIQKQGKTIRKQEMIMSEFQAVFGKYKNSKYVRTGTGIAEDSLYIDLLNSSGIMNVDKVQVLTSIDTDEDKYKIVANGILLNGLGKDEVTECSPIPFDHKMQPYVWSIHEPIDEKFAYGLSIPYKLKDPHKILNTSYSMLLERELRIIDPPIITSDFEAPSLIFGQKKVIPVTDINAYKEFSLNEASGSFFTMMNSLQGIMSSNAQGGSNQIIPSRQPKAAREVVAMENLKVQSLGNALTMYFDLAYQEVILVLKTALQFYQSGKFIEENLLRTVTVPNFPLSRGGVGQLEVRIVKKPQDALKLHFEAVEKSIKNGKTTEIIEVPYELLNNLEFFIDDIKLEPEKSNELERSLFFEQVLTPMMQFFVPMKIADPAKVFLRYLEKFGEHPADYVSNENLPQFMTQWGNQKFEMPMPTGGGQGMTGQMMQIGRGMMSGGQSNGGFGQELVPNNQ